jgi:hypothetical protein
MPFFRSRSPASALTALRDVAHVAPRQRAALVAQAVQELSALPLGRKRAAARAADLPGSLRDIGATGAPVLQLLVDDPELRSELGDQAVALWLDIDAPACVARAIAHVSAWRPTTLVRLALHLDEAEAFDLLEPRFSTKPLVRSSIVAAVDHMGGHRLFKFDRWIDVAIRLMSLDPSCCCDVLRMNDSPRALEELDNILERAETLDLPVTAALNAIERGSPSLDDDEKRPRFIAALAKLLASPAAEGVEHSVLAFTVTLAADALATSPVVMASARARDRIAACQREKPLHVPDAPPT